MMESNGGISMLSTWCSTIEVVLRFRVGCSMRICFGPDWKCFLHTGGVIAMCSMLIKIHPIVPEVREVYIPQVFHEYTLVKAHFR